MHITLIGDSDLAGALVALATRANNTVVHVHEGASEIASCSSSEMMIVAGDRAGSTASVARVASMIREDAIVIDATETSASAQSDGDVESTPESEWMSLVPSTRIVRAFASVPAAAFKSMVDHQTASIDEELAVPMAGDDAEAKEVVAEFMRRIGLQPFDLGPLTLSYVIEPGGPLWGKAVDSLDMRECIGWLSGDG